MGIRTGHRRIDMIYDRLDGITPWPWGMHTSKCGKWLNIVQDRGSSHRGRIASMWTDRREAERNLEFMATAPIEMKWLADTLRLAMAAIDELQQERKQDGPQG